MTVVPGPFDVELASGRYLNVCQPDHRMISLDDIATPLAKTARYGGANVGFYSVAEHAVLVALKLERLGAPRQVVLAGLHHDDAEFALADVQRPVKMALEFLSPAGWRAYERLTRLLDRAVWRALAWPDKSCDPLWRTEDLHSHLVKTVDRWACGFEARHVMASQGIGWQNLSGQEAVADDAADDIACLDWMRARSAYLACHYRLTGLVAA